MAQAHYSSAELCSEMGATRTYRNVDIAFINECTTDNKPVRVYLSRENAIALIRANKNAQVKCTAININEAHPIYKFYVEVALNDLAKIAGNK